MASNFTSNYVVRAISPADLQTAMAAIKALRDVLAPYVIDLTVEDRR